jgi:hypothetical protein
VIIDAHHHLWQRSRGDYDWLDARMNPALAPIERDYLLEDYRTLAAAHGIAGSVLVQAAQTEAETRWLLAQAHASDHLILGVVGWIDMAAPGAADVLGALAQDRLLRAIRPMLQDIPDVDWVLQPRLDAAFRALIDLAIARGGSYYLTYHRFATREQVTKCHPQFASFLALKKKYDPDERFQSDWYRHYRALFSKDSGSAS